MAARTRFFDSLFQDATQAVVRQAVILAAGLDALLSLHPAVARIVAACGFCDILPVRGTVARCVQLAQQNREQAS